jgi:hypothetical protein
MCNVSPKCYPDCEDIIAICCPVMFDLCLCSNKVSKSHRFQGYVLIVTSMHRDVLLLSAVSVFGPLILEENCD